MLEVLQYVLGDLFRFLGVLLLLVVIGDILVAVIRAIRGSDVSPVLTRGLRGSRKPSA